jgi:hypothetical protein
MTSCSVRANNSQKNNSKLPELQTYRDTTAYQVEREGAAWAVCNSVGKEINLHWFLCLFFLV